ncbi:hypothetical protein D3C75_1315050 [compost metagenome]
MLVAVLGQQNPADRTGAGECLLKIFTVLHIQIRHQRIAGQQHLAVHIGNHQRFQQLVIILLDTG